MIERLCGGDLNFGFGYHKNKYPDDYLRFSIFDSYNHSGDCKIEVLMEHAPCCGLYDPTYIDCDLWLELPHFDSKIEALRFIKEHYNSII